MVARRPALLVLVLVVLCLQTIHVLGVKGKGVALRRRLQNNNKEEKEDKSPDKNKAGEVEKGEQDEKAKTDDGAKDKEPKDDNNKDDKNEEQGDRPDTTIGDGDESELVAVEPGGLSMGRAVDLTLEPTNAMPTFPPELQPQGISQGSPQAQQSTFVPSVVESAETDTPTNAPMDTTTIEPSAEIATLLEAGPPAIAESEPPYYKTLQPSNFNTSTGIPVETTSPSVVRNDETMTFEPTVSFVSAAVTAVTASPSSPTVHIATTTSESTLTDTETVTMPTETAESPTNDDVPVVEASAPSSVNVIRLSESPTNSGRAPSVAPSSKSSGFDTSYTPDEETQTIDPLETDEASLASFQIMLTPHMTDMNELALLRVTRQHLLSSLQESDPGFVKLDLVQLFRPQNYDKRFLRSSNNHTLVAFRGTAYSANDIDPGRLSELTLLAFLGKNSSTYLRTLRASKIPAESAELYTLDGVPVYFRNSQVVVGGEDTPNQVSMGQRPMDSIMSASLWAVAVGIPALVCLFLCLATCCFHCWQCPPRRRDRGVNPYDETWQSETHLRKLDHQ